MSPIRTSVPDQLRRRAALLELLLFVAPPAICWVGAFFIWTVAAVFEVPRGFIPWNFWLPIAIFLVVTGICLTACVHIVITFIANGREGLERRHRGWWIAATIGVLLSCIAGINLVHRLPLPSFVSNLPPQANIWLIYGWIGLPAVIPMLHMYLERRAGAKSRHRTGGETTG
jgi:hypothetical protein